MKKAALLVAGLFFALTLTAQEPQAALAGNGKIIKQTRGITAYTKIAVTGPFDVILTSGETGKITIEGDENIVEILITDVNDGILTIATRDEQPVKASTSRKTKIKLAAGNLEKISLNGCGSVSVRPCIKSSKLKATVDGPGSITLVVATADTEVCILGSGTITLKGSTDKLTSRIVGSGMIKACDLETKDVVASVSGSGNIKVSCSSAITGRVIGTGTIAFTGEPQKTDLKFMGSGSFSKD